MTITYTCSECERETEVTVSPIIPAEIYGPAELCHEAEGGEIEPETCSHCGAEIPEEKAHEMASDAAHEQLERKSDRLTDDLRERRLWDA